ncbi:MAG: tetratricopeptide repeat protein [Spirochaetales bacterium]|nr:tetratricopeptide repeat protein [Spirochaetales bacterium]
MLITLTVLYFLGIIGKYQTLQDSNTEKDSTELLEIWERKNYQEVNTLCEEILSVHPLNYEALIFNGFSYFYRGIGQFSLEERLPFIDAAIVNLRKALTLHEDNLNGKLNYILGKAYYQKGKFYSDLSLKYLEESIDSGYIGEDTYEYLGLVYSSLSDYEASAENYIKALEVNPSDTLYLALAQTYYQMNDLVKAEEYSIWSLNSTRDFTVEEKSRFLLGKIYTDREEYLKAEEQYLKILENNSNSADVRYYLGEIYDALGNSTKARFEWRKALEIDPYHYGARLKLY